MNNQSQTNKHSLAPRHEHSFGVYRRYAPLLNRAIATGEITLNPVDVSRQGKMAAYTLVVALRAALVAKRKYFYKVGLPIDNADSRDFKVRELTNGEVVVFYQGKESAVANPTNVGSFTLSWPKDSDTLVELIPSKESKNQILPHIEIHAVSDVETSLRMFVGEVNSEYTVTFQSEWVWKVERVG